MIDPFLPGEPPVEHGWVPCPAGADNPEAAAACDAAMDAAIEAGSMPIIITPDSRTADQLQADVICDLLLGANPTELMGTGLEGIRAQVQVTVAATTLAGLDDAPAQLDGHGAIDPDIARELAGQNTGWTRLFLDAEGFATSTDTYTPTAGMRRFLKARDQHCRFPGCRQPVHRSELDHNLDYVLGGATDIHNLAHLCLSHHVLKHPDIPERYRWTARQREDWTIEWTSPSGRSYIDAPPRRVMFVPSWAEPTPASGTATLPDDDPPPWDDFQPAAPHRSSAWSPERVSGSVNVGAGSRSAGRPPLGSKACPTRLLHSRTPPTWPTSSPPRRRATTQPKRSRGA